MAIQDWYRKKTWTETDKADSIMRLNRSRFHAGQYAKTQAITLLQDNNSNYAHDAIELLNIAIKKDPLHKSNICFD